MGELVASLSKTNKLTGRIETNEILYGYLNGTNSLIGSLNSHDVLSGALSSKNTLIGRINVPTIISGDYDVYTGAYEVIPTPEEIILPTQNKLMRSDVTVREIPYYETTNLSGGSTVYIGGD